MIAPPASSAERSLTRAERAAQTVRVLASEPRPAGGESEVRARAYCRERLRAAGFDVTEEPFEYSAFVGRWGTPIGGLISLAIVWTAAAMARGGRAGVGLVLLTLGAVAVAVFARALGRGVLSFPQQRRRGVNLVATRRSDAPAPEADTTPAPTVWLMAHTDSKSQPVPILVRAAGITLLGIVWTTAIAVAAVQAVGQSVAFDGIWIALTLLAIIGAIPVIATTIGAQSPGALDNATGVATVLAVADDAQATSFGICLTSGEELGLAGALAWVRHRADAPPATVINCDTVDDHGTTTCMYSGARPDALIGSVVAAGSRAGAIVRAHRLLPGVLTDGVAIANAGWKAVTLSKGGVRTLARVHTAGDRPDELTGAGMDEVARLIVELLEARAT